MFLFLLAFTLGPAISVVVALKFYIFIRRTRAPRLPVDQQHEAVVVLSVRGCDPTLPSTVKGLLNQEFRDYSVVVVVDNAEDSAWSVLEQLKIEFDVRNRLTIRLMDPPRSTCSLKCNSIIGAVESLSDTVKWVALVDADVEVYPHWLADLLGPLADKSVCVSTGQQWFEPNERSSKGALVRSIWNAGAMVPSVLLKHPWAGSLAVRYEDLIVSTLVNDWKTAIVDDGPMIKFANQIGGKIFVTPALLMVNREDCSVRFAVSWISRMLTWSRIYESTFWITMVHSMCSGMLVAVWCLLFLIALLSMNWGLLVVLVVSGFCAAALMTTGYCIVRSAVDVSLRRRDLPGLQIENKLGIRDLLSVGFMMGPVQLIYLTACVKAQRAKSVTWRGIDYRIEDGQVEMEEYVRFEAPATANVDRSI